ncbi:MAG: YggT family protein [Bacillota bacterium]|nr:YggT family protein [Bacillota bacterium]
MIIINRLVAEGLIFFIQIYYIILFARIIMSWFAPTASRNQTFNTLYRIAYVLTEPLLAPLRKVIPAVRVGMGYLDLSPFILLILLRVAQQLIIRYIYF